MRLPLRGTSQAARGPSFLLLQKGGKDRPKGLAAPLETPLPSRWTRASPANRAREGRNFSPLRG